MNVTETNYVYRFDTKTNELSVTEKLRQDVKEGKLYIFGGYALDSNKSILLIILIFLILLI